MATSQNSSRPTLRILGTRGVPAAHGGFETFAEQLSLYLVRQGWRVIVYCQEDGSDPVHQDVWQGVERVHIPVKTPGSAGTMVFDWIATRHAARHRDLCLTLGYNTAIFCVWLRLAGVPNVINMDGVEWRRQKWGASAKTWFWLNDWAGCLLGNHLVADNPGIDRHLRTRVRPDKITTIPYGADRVTAIDDKPVRDLGLQPQQYWTLIARPEPENSVLEIVQAYSRKRRGAHLAVLGRYEIDRNPYHAAVVKAASSDVKFLGAIYEQSIVKALRFHGRGYIHGHQVGGTNPSLVEALGAGNPVIAHDNEFNRWVAGAAGVYFGNEDQCAKILDELPADGLELAAMRQASRDRFEDGLTWKQVLHQYEQLLRQWLPAAP